MSIRTLCALPNRYRDKPLHYLQRLRIETARVFVAAAEHQDHQL